MDRGYTNLISTILLSSFLLSLMLIASYLSSDLLNLQIAQSELKSAEGLLETIDENVEGLLHSPGSSLVFRTSLSKAMPSFADGGILNITIRDAEGFHNYSYPMKIIRIEGGRGLSGTYEYDVRGGGDLLVSPSDGYIGRIHVSKPLHVLITLDYNRVLYIYTGIVKLYNGSDYVPHNTVELILVQLRTGEFKPGNKLVILIENMGVETQSLLLSGDVEVTVSSEDGHESIRLSEMGGNPAYSTLLILRVVEMRVSITGGD